jgi:predicted membrane protein
MTAVAHPQPVEHARVGRFVFGLALIALGIGWLLEIVGVDVPWDLVFPAALIVIGVTLIAASPRGTSQAGLLTAGVALTAFLVLASAVNVSLRGGVGVRTEHPASYSAIAEEYRLGIGDLTLDLSDVDDLAGVPVRAIHVGVGVGHLVVLVPPDTTVHVSASAALGSVHVFGQTDSGFDASRVTSRDPGLAAGLDLVLSVGLGQVEVLDG